MLLIEPTFINIHDVVETATDDQHRNPNLKAEDVEYWKSLVSQSNNKMSYPIQEEDSPYPSDSSSDAPSVSPSNAPSVVSPSNAPSVSPSEVVTTLEVSMSYMP